MSELNNVRHVNLHTAEEFLNAISPRSKYLEGGLHSFLTISFFVATQMTDGDWFRRHSE